MSRWRLGVLLVLFGAPFMFMIGAGGYYLWERGWAFYTWWPMALCFLMCFALAHYWHRRKALLPKLNLEALPHGSERDREAWKLVEARVGNSGSVSSANLTDPDYYMKTAQEMALEMARFYHPDAQNPYSMLTVPEMLSVAELAAHDLNEMVLRYVPASHLLTIDDYRKARHAVDWYRRANNVYWLASAVMNPLETAARYFTSRFATGGTWNLLQQNILVWFYSAFVQRVGTYLIELHSGRLRVGADRYRQLVEQNGSAESLNKSNEVRADGAIQCVDTQPAPEVTITLIGQVKAGKSSLINALLGEQKAESDVLPLTSEVTRYLLRPPNVDSQLVLLDTVGYGNEGPNEDQIRATEAAACRSDLILIVMHARNPARKSDVQTLERLTQWFAANPNLRMPPVIGIVTHIDLLSPAMEWSPPYNWREPNRQKEIQINQALAAARKQFADRLAIIVPACTAPGKVFGIDEAVLPAIVERLGEARSVGLLRCLKAEADSGKIKRIFNQLRELGCEVARVAWAGSAR
jgi:uncharacterized protein